jgi:putative transposase
MDVMSAEGSDGRARSLARRSRIQAAIIFGSAASQPAREAASVRATCEAIGLPRSTYYYHSQRSAEALEFEHRILLRLLELREQHPSDGYRRMTFHLQSEGFHVNRKRIARLMQLHSLGVKPAHAPERPSLFHRRLTPTRTIHETSPSSAATQIWIADLAYVHILTGIIYTAAIIDVRSREVVGYSASTHINARLPAIALHSAVRAHRPGLGCIHHSTYGVQYLMRGYHELLRQYGLVPGARERVRGPGVRATQHPTPGPVREVIEMPGYEGWDDVIARADEFVRELYSPERIASIVQTYSNNLAATAAAAERHGVDASLTREALDPHP